MKFVVQEGGWPPDEGLDEAILVADNWNDFFEYQTLYDLTVFDKDGKKFNLGAVKIGQFKMTQRRPSLPESFERLEEEFFSLGQDDSYYEMLSTLPHELMAEILLALRDVVADPHLWEKVKNQDVTQVSLLRNVSEKSVEGQFRRIIHGGERLTKYDFEFVSPEGGIKLSFSVLPESHPPTNLHVLIGRNGVGKTYTLRRMVKSLLGDTAVGAFRTLSAESGGLFAGLVWVSFSAFDEFLAVESTRQEGLKFSYIGLRNSDGDANASEIDGDYFDLTPEKWT